MRGSLPYSIGLGLVPTGKRSVTPMPASLKALVPRPTGNNTSIKGSNADPIRDTVPLIQQMVKRQLGQGKKLAAALKGKTLEETLRNNWNFIFNHIQYKEDPTGSEEVRSLRRLVYDGEGDCDCFVSGLSNLLTNQGIDHKLRVAKYKGDWQHTYIVVPKQTGYYTIDPVVHQFNYEVPFTDKKDFDMMALKSLDGFDGACDKDKGSKPKKLLVIPGKQLQDAGLVKTDAVLASANIPFTQTTVDNELAYMVNTKQGTVTLSQFVPHNQQQNLIAKLTAVGDNVKAELTDGKLSKGEMIVGLALLALIVGALVGSSSKQNKKAEGLNGARSSKKLATLKI